MTPNQSLIFLAVVGLIAGFAMMRGNVCSVLTTRQIVELGRFTRLKAFMYSIAWSIVVMLPLVWMGTQGFRLYPHFPVTKLAVIAGCIYGLGAFVNGACVFGVCSRTVSGDVHFLFALPGIAFGALLSADAGLAPAGPPAQPEMIMVPTVVSVTIFCVACALAALSGIGIWSAYARPGMGAAALLRAQRWRSSLAMAVLGISGALLFASGQIWNFPVLLRQIGNWIAGRPYSFPPSLFVGTAALYGGALLAVVTGGRTWLQRPDLAVNVRSFIGGSLMGFGASLIPGGNDVLLLYAVPALAPQAIIAYASFLGTLIVLAMIAKRVRHWQTRDEARPAPRPV